MRILFTYFRLLVAEQRPLAAQPCRLRRPLRPGPTARHYQVPPHPPRRHRARRVKQVVGRSPHEVLSLTAATTWSARSTRRPTPCVSSRTGRIAPYSWRSEVSFMRQRIRSVPHGGGRRDFMKAGGLAVGVLAAEGCAVSRAATTSTTKIPRSASFGWELANLNGNGANAYFSVPVGMVLDSLNIDVSAMPLAASGLAFNRN